jgi:hypothetical protein
MINEAINLIKQGDPSNWPKTKENKQRVDKMGGILHSLTGDYVDCAWCNRTAVYKHLKKYLEGNGHL